MLLDKTVLWNLTLLSVRNYGKIDGISKSEKHVGALWDRDYLVGSREYGSQLRSWVGSGVWAEGWLLEFGGYCASLCSTPNLCVSIKLQMVWNFCPEKGPRKPRGMCVSLASVKILEHLIHSTGPCSQKALSCDRENSLRCPILEILMQ